MRGAVAALVLFLGACSNKNNPSIDGGVTTSRRVTLMTFNTENLFDTEHDSGKLDHSFLPAHQKMGRGHQRVCEKIKNVRYRQECLHLDWSPEVMNGKLKRLADVILSVENGRGPDILVLQEVENLGVLERLRVEYLEKGEYAPGSLLEGGDARGIDVGVLTRLPLGGEPILHAIPYVGVSTSQKRAMRGILEVPLILPGGAHLTLFALHLPAPPSPRILREQALEYLRVLKKGASKKGAVAAAGDFNITAGEDEVYGVLKRASAGLWLLPHKDFCSGCRGTHFYRHSQTWSFLDLILLSQDMDPEVKTGWVLVPDSVRVVSDTDQQRMRDGGPACFDPVSQEGVSDHWPFMLSIIRRN